MSSVSPSTEAAAVVVESEAVTPSLTAAMVVGKFVVVITAVVSLDMPVTSSLRAAASSSGEANIDLLLVTETTTLSVGSIRVFAVIVDASDKVGPASVDREQLA